MALWLMLLAQGILNGNRDLVLGAALGAGASAAASWFLRVISDRIQRRFRDKLTIALESHVASLQASIPTIAHHERPEYLDRLAVLRDQVFVLDHIFMSLFSTCGWVLRLAATVVLLASIHPALALLALFALPTVFCPPGGRESNDPPRNAGRPPNAWPGTCLRPPQRRRRRKKRASCGLRITGAPATRDLGALVWAGRRAPVGRVRAGIARPGPRSGGLGERGRFRRVLSPRLSQPGAARPGGPLRSVRIHRATVGEIGFLWGIWLDGSEALAWLEDYAAARPTQPDTPVPASLSKGIRLRTSASAIPDRTDGRRKP